MFSLIIKFFPLSVADFIVLPDKSNLEAVLDFPLFYELRKSMVAIFYFVMLTIALKLEL